MKKTVVYEVNKSKFIPYFFNIETVEEINSIIQKIKKEHKKARHICYAYIINEQKMGFFDDGEPRGTAGKPLLCFLQLKKQMNSLIIVVRYFGGTKLGAGKLLRSYVKAASLII
ncbi:proline dipeptidase pepQ [Mesomycoplasma neurolyticum]|uniref:Proline dipeptidase pepQ n=2 Tax=Mesomycoplasma neurolyticum TaxID=2120 RepID=A0A449A4Q8_9BACT|nr:proline dipeptidase pepQ [Mesomycoplasma neurolyticum]